MPHRVLLALILVVFAGVHSTALACTNGNTTTVVYGNGIGNTEDDAKRDRDLLKTAVLAGIDPVVDQTCLSYQLSFDSQFYDPINGIQGIDNFLSQLVNAAAQQGIDVAANFWNYWYGLLSQPPPAFAQVQNTIIASATSVFQPDLVRHVTFYNNELALGHNVIVVAHSQGNLYVNQAYSTVTAFGGANQFHVIAVASPAISVAGSGPHFTLVGDIITLVPGSLLANEVNGADAVVGGTIPSPCLSFQAIACHNFAKSYMAGDNTGSAIVTAVRNLLPKIPSILFDNLGNRQFCTVSGSGAQQAVSCSGALIGFIPPLILPQQPLVKAATAFDAPTGGTTYNLTSIELPVYLSAGTNQVTITVYTDASGLPNTSSIVATQTLTGAMTTLSSLASNPTFPTLSLSFVPGTVTLKSGTRYWVEVSMPQPDSRGIWPPGMSGAVGNYATTRSGNPYILLTGQQPAMRVVVTPP